MRALEGREATTTAWGVDSEYGRLLDVLLCPPDNFRWLPASAISRATLESGLSFSREDAQRQHAEMVAVYEEAGVRVHFLEPDPALPYQVFARDSSINVPQGPIVTQPATPREAASRRQLSLKNTPCTCPRTTTRRRVASLMGGQVHS